MEFKFRAWDRKFNQMSYPFGWDTSTAVDFPLHYSISKLDLDDHERFEVMMYSGLKDSQGTEICEGDIIAVGDGEFEYEVMLGVYGNCSGFYLSKLGMAISYPFSELKIVGNKYEMVQVERRKLC
jgi:hypothetical protein